jgi:hypothetical protein
VGRDVNNQVRDYAIREIQCIACRLIGRRPMPAAKHHLISTGLHGNGKRRGEKATIGLCDYHHQGASQVGTQRARSLKEQGYGPSLADEPRAFRARFGTDNELLALQDKLIEAWQKGNV